MTLSKLPNKPKPNKVYETIDNIIDVVNTGSGGGGGTATTVQINGTSITSNNVADIQTNGTYNASSNKIATMFDLSGKANDSAVVHNTGDETISGVKDFNNQIYVKNSTTQSYEPVLTYPSATNTYALKSLSNMDSSITSIPPTTLYNFDGQFVQSTLTISTNTRINNYEHYIGTTGPNPRNYLPDNDYVYMVYGQIVTNSNTSCRHWLGTGSTPATNENCFRVLSRTASSSVLGVNYFALPVVPDSNGYQILYEQIVNADAATNAEIVLMGYRRVGTNN